MNCWIDAMFRLTFRLGLWPWAWAVGLALPAAATPTLEQEQEIRATFVTPHTAWAKPYAGGNDAGAVFQRL
jgi:hypothetical protein